MPDGLTVTLPPDLAAFVQGKVESGEYASAEEVVRAGLEELRFGEAELAAEVLPALREHLADPDAAVPLDEVMAEFRRPVAGR